MGYSKKKEESMTIGIDARLWSETGVGRYIRNLVINLHEIDDKNDYVLFLRKKDVDSVNEKINKKNWKIIETNIKWHSFSEQLNFPRVLNKQNLDLMHFPYFSIPIFYKRKYIITIHDLILHHYISGSSSSLPIWLYGFKMLAYKGVMNISARNAKKIISVSHATKNEIVDHLITDKNKISVIYEASDDLRSEVNKNNEYGDYFLYVGNVYTHKNVYNLVSAFEKVIKNKKVKLIFVGKKDSFYDQLKKKTKKMKNSVIYIDNAKDEELISLYKNAIALVRPSLMEGFSLPPLEAISNNCIALVSDIPVHREILSDSAIYFDPSSVDDLVLKMDYVLNLSEDSKKKLKENGINISNEFSWIKTARQTLYVYESCTGI